MLLLRSLTRLSFRGLVPSVLFLTTMTGGACGGLDESVGPDLPCADCPRPPDLSGSWQTRYGFDATPVISLPSPFASLDELIGAVAPGQVDLWPDEFIPLRSMLEPLLESVLERALPPEIRDFFRELDASSSTLRRVEVLGRLAVFPDAGGFTAQERWTALNFPDGCEGRGLQVALDERLDSGGPIVFSTDGLALSFERSRHVNPEDWARRLVNEMVWCVTDGRLSSVRSLFEDGLRCDELTRSEPFAALLHPACLALRSYWAHRYEVPVDSGATWRIGQVGRWLAGEEGPILGASEDVWVDTGTIAAPVPLQWSAERLPRPEP
ncbi:MAG: hypothetical protein ACFB9M_15770 [Myxococcota bacterium]